ncbi:Jerky -like [Araneus ventricosus]|uniref:Jerky-like n=1 Tax=Araneus ventricosus TaxID=182803 RepID=A0A4Y2GP68_ARAVE|nr:Jerky -like [Araneus ventricosus]
MKLFLVFTKAAKRDADKWSTYPRKGTSTKHFNGWRPTFVASRGWLDPWKKRHGVHQLCITGKKLSSDYMATEEFIKEIDDLISSENYLAQQVYNCDESGLNFKLCRKKNLACQEESCAPGFEMGKERVTVLACSNATGDKKLPLMFIGKSKNPRGIKKCEHECTSCILQESEKKRG